MSNMRIAGASTTPLTSISIDPATSKSQNESVPKYIAGTTGGNIAQRFNQRYGSPPRSGVRATRADLGLNNNQVFLLDIGGEGAKHDVNPNGHDSGNVNAVNLNWEESISPGVFDVQTDAAGTTRRFNTVKDEVGIPNLIRPSSSWFDDSSRFNDPSYPLADHSVDAIMMEGAPLRGSGPSEINRILDPVHGWALLNIDPSFESNVEYIARAHDGRLIKIERADSPFTQYLITPSRYAGPDPATWIASDGHKGVDSAHFYEFVSGPGKELLGSAPVPSFPGMPQPDPKPGMEPTQPKPGSEIGSEKSKPITGQTYSDNVKAIARSVQGAMVFGFLSTTFDAKNGFDNETVKQHFLDMAKYRAQSAPIDAINYDDELNATAAALADPVHGIVNRYGGDNEFASDPVKSHFKNLVLQKLIEQQTPAPELNTAEDAVLQDVRNRLMNALNGRSDKNLRLQIYDDYISDPDAGKHLSHFVAKEAYLDFTNDPYLYLRPNARGQDGFPWQLVLDDIDNEVKLQSYKYYKRDLHQPFEDYVNREGRALVQQWWQTSA